MPRTILLAALLAAAGAAAVPAARAGIVVDFNNVSAHAINSGGSFTFDIRLSGDGVASYDIITLITGSTGTAGIDFDSSAPDSPPSSGYVFTTPTTNFHATLQPVPGSPRNLSLDVSDYSYTEVTGAAGDLISTITVTTAADFVGSITVTFDLDNLLLVDADGEDITDFGHGEGFTVLVGKDVPPPVIPEPASAVMLSLGALTLAGLARRARS